MHAQVDSCQVRSTGLRLLAKSLYVVAHASPRVDFVGKFQRQLKVIVGPAIANCIHRRAVAGYSCARRGRTDSHRREVIGAVIADHRSGLGILRLCCLQVLVGDIYLFFQSTQLRVVEYFPPVAPETYFVRLGSFPVAGLFICLWRFLVSRRNFDLRAVILGADGTAGKQEHASHKDCRQTITADSGFSFCIANQAHCAPPVEAGCTTWTFCPETIESCGLRISDSSPLRPETISTCSPKSRPGVTGVSVTRPFFTTATCKPCARKISAETGTRYEEVCPGTLRCTSEYAPVSNSPPGLSTSA